MKFIPNIIRQFAKCESGQSMLYSTVLFSAAVIVIAVAATPFLDKASKSYANNDGYGIDFTTTASVRQSQPKVKTYTIRKSVFDRGSKKICRNGQGAEC